MNIEYILVDPVKNYTILVKTPVEKSDRRFVASRLMKEEKLAEQVGFLGANTLEMAGGEFCGNAVRSAAYYLQTNEINIIGRTIKCDNTAVYIPKDIEGIKHYIYEEMIDNPEAEAVKLSNGEAVGLMFFNEKEMSLKPLVYVPSIDTMFWENSCASGTAALASYLAKKYNKDIDFDISEPGGILNIKTSPDDLFVRLDGNIEIVKEGKLCIPELNY